MDYKDKYNEVFEKAKKVLLDCTPEEQNVVEYIFPELKVSEDEKIRQALIKYYSFDEDGHSHALDNITPEQIVAWLEKQGEQNSNNESTDTINKTEAPLVIDGWVVRKDGKTFHDKRKFAKIIKIDEEGRYWLDCGTWIRPNEIRHWTINDAEDGDVLVYPSTSAGDKECPFIFKEIDKNGIVRFHAALIQNETLYIDDGVTNVLGYARRGYHIPATKEQRDILFQKMGEEAWEWDNDKKELKSHYKFIVTKDSRKGLEMTT